MTGSAVLRIVTLGGSSDQVEAALNVLRKAGYGVRHQRMDETEALADLIAAADGVPPCDLLLHFERPLGTPLEVLGLLAGCEAEVPAILIDEAIDEAEAIDWIDAGARDIVLPGRNEQLLRVVRRELAAAAARRSTEHFEALFQASEQRCQELLASSSEAIAYLVEGMHLAVNDTYVRLFGYESAPELHGLSLLDLIAPDDEGAARDMLRQPPGDQAAAWLELSCRKAGGVRFPARVRLTRATYQGEECRQLTVQDLSRDAAHEAQLHRLRTLDRLTGLLNHRHFLKRLERVAPGAAGPAAGHLLLIEIENFRSIRKNLGISASDEVVRDLSRQLVAELGDSDVGGRVGDHTFAVFSPSSPAETESLTERLRSAVENTICTVADQSISTTCSIGVLGIEGTSMSADAMMSLADNACREAIQAGGNQVKVHLPAERQLAAANVMRRPLSEEIPNLIAERRLALAFQPIVNLRGRSSESYEVLLRAWDELGEVIPTQLLFSAAAEAGLVADLDRFVVERTIETADGALAQGRAVRFFVKLSGAAIQDESVLLHIAQLLGQSRVDPQQLVFQLDEETVAGHVKLARTAVEVLRKLNCPTALEHFGTGRASFTTLSHLNVDYLKLHGSMVDQLTLEGERQQAITRVQDLARSLNKQTIATSVQDANSLAIVWQCGIHLAQGHYIQEPEAHLGYNFAEAF